MAVVGDHLRKFLQRAQSENYKRVRFLQQNNLRANEAEAASVEIWMLVGSEETIRLHRHALGSDLN